MKRKFEDAMPWGIGYTVCTVLTIIAGVCAMRDQRGKGRGPIVGLVVGIVAGGLTGAFLMIMLAIITMPESHIEKVEPSSHE